MIDSPIMIPPIGGGDGFFLFHRAGVRWVDGSQQDTLFVQSQPSTELGLPVASAFAGEVAVVAYPEHLVRLNREFSEANCNAHLMGKPPVAVGVSDNFIAAVLGSRLKIFDAKDFRIRLDQDVREWLKTYQVRRLRFAIPIQGTTDGKPSVEELFLVCEGTSTLVASAKLLPPSASPTDPWTLVLDYQGDPSIDLHTCTQVGREVYLAGQLQERETHLEPVFDDQGNKVEDKEVVEFVDYLMVQRWSEDPWEHEEALKAPKGDLGTVRQLVVGEGLIVCVFEDDRLRVYRDGAEIYASEGVVKSAAILGPSTIVVHDGTSPTLLHNL